MSHMSGVTQLVHGVRVKNPEPVLPTTSLLTSLQQLPLAEVCGGDHCKPACFPNVSSERTKDYSWHWEFNHR